MFLVAAGRTVKRERAVRAPSPKIRGPGEDNSWAALIAGENTLLIKKVHTIPTAPCDSLHAHRIPWIEVARPRRLVNAPRRVVTDAHPDVGGEHAAALLQSGRAEYADTSHGVWRQTPRSHAR
jgi:hypothetical protein